MDHSKYKLDASTKTCFRTKDLPLSLGLLDWKKNWAIIWIPFRNKILTEDLAKTLCLRFGPMGFYIKLHFCQSLAIVGLFASHLL
jgi:hypothetical protein